MVNKQVISKLNKRASHTFIYSKFYCLGTELTEVSDLSYDLIGSKSLAWCTCKSGLHQTCITLDVGPTYHIIDTLSAFFNFFLPA